MSESSLAWKEAGGIDILVSSGNDERKILNPVRITSQTSTRMKKRNHFRQ